MTSPMFVEELPRTFFEAPPVVTIGIDEYMELKSRSSCFALVLVLLEKHNPELLEQIKQGGSLENL